MPFSRHSPQLLVGSLMAVLAFAVGWGWRSRTTVAVDRKVLGIVSTARVASLHPHLHAPPGFNQLRTRLIQAMWEGLVEFDEATYQPRPAVAESWEIAPDARSAIFHLRKDARWDSGRPVEADDFVFAWRRAVVSRSYAAEPLAILKNARRYNGSGDGHEIGVTALDPHTLKLELERPVPGLLADLCDPAWFPLPAGEAATNKVPPSNGAFRLVSFGPDQIVLEANPYYHDRHAVHLDRIEVHYVEDASLYGAFFRSGRVQLSDRLLTGEIDTSSLPGVEVWRDPTLATGYVHFNLRRGPLADARIRRALSLAVDRTRLANSISPVNVRPARSCLPPIPEWEDVVTVREDLAEARRLLAEAGYPEGKGFPVLHWPYRASAIDASVRLPDACAAQWRENLGIPVYLVPLGDGEFADLVAERDYDVVLQPVNGTLPNLGRLAMDLCGPEMRTLSGWDGGAVTALALAARELTGGEMRERMLAVERAFLAEMPAAPMVCYNRHTLVGSRLLGWKRDPTGQHPLKLLDLRPAAENSHAPF